MKKLGNDWDDFLQEETAKPYYLTLREFLKSEYRQGPVFPPMNDIYNALRYTPYAEVKVVILGQDPYIHPGEAHGLAFSVQPTAKIPPSLMNIFKELNTDLGCAVPNNGYLVKWAKQGVLLLNASLTVRAWKSGSHAGKGWEVFTTSVIKHLNEKQEPIVFLLWGNNAKAKAPYITNPAHKILEAAHPSPLAGGRFFGCKHFSQTNDFLTAHGLTPIDWQIENV